MTYEPLDTNYPPPNPCQNSLKATLLLRNPMKTYKPGDSVEVTFKMTALQPVYLEHLMAGYACRSSTQLLNRDMKLFNETPKGLNGIEHHFLVNEDEQLCREPRMLARGERVELSFLANIPPTDHKYSACKKHTVPIRGGLFSKLEEDQRILPPCIEVKLSDCSVISVSHYVKVEMGFIHEGKETWSTVSYPLNIESAIERIPRNWDHIYSTKADKIELPPKVFQKVREVEIKPLLFKSFSNFASEGDAVLKVEFLDSTTLQSPLGPINRGLFTNRLLSDYLQLTVSLPEPLVKLKHYQRAVQLVETRAVLKKTATINGGIFLKQSQTGDYHYRKRNKIYTQTIEIGAKRLKFKLQSEYDKESKYLNFAIPEEAIDLLTPRAEISTRACNFCINFSLVLLVKILIGTSSVIELACEIPVIMSELSGGFVIKKPSSKEGSVKAESTEGSIERESTKEESIKELSVEKESTKKETSKKASVEKDSGKDKLVEKESTKKEFKKVLTKIDFTKLVSTIRDSRKNDATEKNLNEKESTKKEPAKEESAEEELSKKELSKAEVANNKPSKKKSSKNKPFEKEPTKKESANEESTKEESAKNGISKRQWEGSPVSQKTVVEKAKSWIRKGIFKEELTSSDEAEESNTEQDDEKKPSKKASVEQSAAKAEEAVEELQIADSKVVNFVEDRAKPNAENGEATSDAVPLEVNDNSLAEAYESVSTLVENSTNSCWDSFIDIAS